MAGAFVFSVIEELSIPAEMAVSILLFVISCLTAIPIVSGIFFDPAKRSPVILFESVTSGGTGLIMFLPCCRAGLFLSKIINTEEIIISTATKAAVE